MPLTSASIREHYLAETHSPRINLLSESRLHNVVNMPPQVWLTSTKKVKNDANVSCARLSISRQKAAESWGGTALNAISRYVGGGACYHQFTENQLSETVRKGVGATL